MLTVDKVRLAQQGDCEAFIRLVTGMERTLYRLARSVLRRDEDCADVIQEAIYKAYRAIHTLREPAYFQTWLCRILLNECHQLASKQKRFIYMEDLPGKSVSSSVETDYENIDYLDLIEAIDRLEELHRLVISLHSASGKNNCIVQSAVFPAEFAAHRFRVQAASHGQDLTEDCIL